jgi:hypothetical protein
VPHTETYADSDNSDHAEDEEAQEQDTTPPASSS